MKYFSFSNLSDFFPGIRITANDYSKIYKIVYQMQEMIPEDSLIRFLQYRVTYFDVLYAHRNEGDDEMIKIKRRLIELFYDAQNTWEEVYTTQQVADIFGVSLKEVKKELRKHSRFKVLLPKEITATDILLYLNKHSEIVDQLKDRHSMLLANGDLMESSVRHILMLYSYYQTNGYIV